MLLAHRSQDSVIAIYQDNNKRDIIINDINAAAVAALGYEPSEIKGKSLGLILPARIFQLLNEYVEYKTDGNDVGSVLNKIPSFCVVNKNKQELDFRLKIARTTPLNGHDQFAMMLIAAQNNRRNEAFRSLLKENFKGHELLDPTTGLPDRSSMHKDVEFVLFYVMKKELAASVAIIELDQFEELQKAHSAEIMADLFKHMAQLIKQNLRSDDTIGFLAPKRLAIILFDTSSESARMVLNRLRWLIAAHPFKDIQDQPIHVHVSIGYHSLSQDLSEKEAFEKLEQSMQTGKIAGNNVQEVTF